MRGRRQPSSPNRLHSQKIISTTYLSDELLIIRQKNLLFRLLGTYRVFKRRKAWFWALFASSPRCDDFPALRCAGAPEPYPCNPHPPDCVRRSSLTASASPACSVMRDRLCSDPSPNGITIEHLRVVLLALRDEGRQRRQSLRRVPDGAPLLVDELHAEGEPTSRRREHQLTEQPALERWAASCPFGQRCCCRLASLRWEAF